MLQLISILLFIHLIQGNDAFNKTINGVSGPCIGNRNNMKCTKNGFYEKIQCNKNSCYCVAAHNGIPAYNTRTSSPQTKPTCGKCLNHLEKMFENGKTNQDIFIPQCDVLTGNYELYQCSAKQKFCYCSNENGVEIKGSRIKLQQTAEKIKLQCGNKSYDIAYYQYSNLEENYELSFKSHMPRVLRNRPMCTYDRDPGYTCKEKKPSIRYWFDPETMTCLPFEYKGCGGNENNFERFCDNCLPMDYDMCAFESRRAQYSNGGSVYCGRSYEMSNNKKENDGINKTKDGCPVGYYCQLGGMGFGNCCDAELSDYMNKAYNYKCTNGSPALEDNSFGYKRTIRGKTCADNFCPAGSKCEQGKVYAFCCK